jgi:gamma-glutamyltranspeptidase
MNNINDSSAHEISGHMSNIPGPYFSREQTESFPLKPGGAGNRANGWRSVMRCCSGSANKSGNGLHIIVLCFVVITLAVVIALAVQIYYGDYQLVPHGSVATDSAVCSLLGTDIMKSGGNAVDAAIAAVVCLGVVNPHVTGLGGGGFMIIYNHRKQSILDVIDFREVAPATINISKDAPGSYVGVPGVLRGLAMAHQLHGMLPWIDIIMPAVHIARSGFRVSESLFAAKSYLKPSKFNDRLMKWMEDLEAGQNLTLPELANTLELIAVKGPDVFYDGSLGKDVVQAIASAGGQMMDQDLATYQAVRRPVLTTVFADFNILVPDVPSGGPALLAALKLLPDINSTAGGQGMFSSHVVTLANASEGVYREALLGVWGDPDFSAEKYEHNYDGSEITSGKLMQPVGSHVAAVDLNDIYVSVVSGLNVWFGSQLLTNGGFLLNNALANFGQGKNSPFPGKRPMSLATPIIATEKRRVCGRRLLIGAADATVAAQVLSRLLVFDKNITLSIENARFQIADGNSSVFVEDQHEPSLSESSQKYLKLSGYNLQALPKPYQSCNIVAKFGDYLSSHSDSRGGGVASRF